MQLWSADDVRQALSPQVLVPAMTDVLSDLARGRAFQPLRWVLDLAPPALLGLMPAWLPERRVVGAKLLTVFPDNPGAGRPGHQGVVVLFDDQTGSPLAIVDAEAVTALRTAAVSAVATECLARPDACTLALLGTGTQAETHLVGLMDVRPFTRVRVWSRNREHAAAFQRRMAGRVRVVPEPAASPADAVAGADVVCTLTGSPTPILDAADVDAGTHINAVGACRPRHRELGTALVARGRLYVDHREAAAREAGDYLIPLAEGAIADSHIVAELGQVLVGERPGRQAPADVTIFKALGLAVEDVAAAAVLYGQRAFKASPRSEPAGG